MLNEIKTQNRFIGFKQSKRAIEDGSAVKAFIAEDCAPDIRDTLHGLCHRHGVEVEYVPTMKQLGSEAGVDVGSSVVVLVR